MRPRKPHVRFTPELAGRIYEALEAGHGLRRIVRQPGMPTRATVMRWLKTRREFADLVGFARWLGALRRGAPDGLDMDDRPRRGRPAADNPRLRAALYQRLCAGEPLKRICRDPAMPSRSTVHNWMRRDAELARSLGLARELADWAAVDHSLSALGFDTVEAYLAAPLPEVPGPGRPRKQPAP